MGILDIFSRTRRLSSVLTQTFKVKVQGVNFELRKIDPLDFLEGTKAVKTYYDTYKTQGELTQMDAAMMANAHKIRQHQSDVFLAGVVSPKLVRKQEDSDKGVWVENLFSDWSLVNDLYIAIMEVTYGKKKRQ